MILPWPLGSTWLNRNLDVCSMSDPFQEITKPSPSSFDLANEETSVYIQNAAS